MHVCVCACVNVSVCLGGMGVSSLPGGGAGSFRLDSLERETDLGMSSDPGALLISDMLLVLVLVLVLFMSKQVQMKEKRWRNHAGEVRVT